MIEERSKVNVHQSHLEEDFEDEAYPKEQPKEEEEQYEEVFEKEETKAKDGKEEAPIK